MNKKIKVVFKGRQTEYFVGEGEPYAAERDAMIELGFRGSEPQIVGFVAKDVVAFIDFVEAA
jgi:hypothetical protein